MSEKEAYEKKLQAQLDTWSAEITKLKAKASEVEANAQLELHKQIDELNAKRQTVQDKLKDIKEASGDAWKDIKSGVDLAWSSLSEAVKSATSRFK
jgi:chromosome segregation ATPase